jgi:hypothetical protein
MEHNVGERRSEELEQNHLQYELEDKRRRIEEIDDVKRRNGVVYLCMNAEIGVKRTEKKTERTRERQQIEL